MADEGFDISYIARLAHLELGEEEANLFSGQLGSVLNYMEKLKELNVDNIEPTMHGHGRVNAFREDEVRPSMDRDAALNNAPGRTETEFLLPKVVEDA